MKRFVSSLISCLGVLCLSLGSTAASTVFVDADAPGPVHDGSSWATAFPTVTQGLSAAKDGDEVWVAAGTYIETVTLTPGAGLYGGFGGTETERAQRDPGAHLTIVDGNAAGTVVTVPENAPATTVLDGFTIRNGAPTGVRCQDGSSPVIRNNTVSGCASTGVSSFGGQALLEGNTIVHNLGGVFIIMGGAVVRDNVIRWNPSGGIVVSSAPDNPCTITGNLIADSTGTGGQFQSAGIAIRSTLPRVFGNRLERNNVGILLGSGIMSDTRIEPRVVGNVILASRDVGIKVQPPADATIVGNVIAGGGTGIEVRHGQHTIANNTITGNAQEGIYVEWTTFSPPTVQILNNIIAYNGIAVDAHETGTYVLRRNCFHANGEPNPSYTSYLKPTAEDLVADPLLADPSRGDLHIALNSPCRDAGESLPILADLHDIDGQPRVQGASVDIGADESDGTVPAFVVPVVYVRPDGDDASDGSTWAAAKRTVKAGIDAAGCGEVWIAGGVYRERVTLPPLVHLYGGFIGNETGRDGVRAHETVLDGMKGGSVLTVLTGNLVNIVDGLTITNGAADSGGGVFAHGGVILEHCVVRSNTAKGGGGVCTRAGTPILRGNFIEANTASVSAGGVRLDWGTVSATLERNVIRWNTDMGFGAGVYGDRASLLLRSNVIVGNEGGGVDSMGNLEMFHNTVVGNTGFGVRSWFGTSTVVNNIIAFNTGTSAYSFSSSGRVFRNNCIFGNTGGQSPAPSEADGNIVADPLFVNRFGDNHLRAGSPCIDAGDNAVWRMGDLDIDGQPRRIGPRVDIGADENTYDAVLLSEVGSALRVVGGMEAVTPETLARWNVNLTGSPDSLTLEDARQLARKALGLE